MLFVGDPFRSDKECSDRDTRRDGSRQQEKKETGVAELYQAGYEYNLSRYGSSASSYLMINAVGRLADGRFDLSLRQWCSYANF